MAKRNTDKTWLQQTFPPIHREGIKFTFIAGIIALILFMIYIPLGFFGIFLTLCVYGFFRDPERITPEGEGLVIAPADGLICDVSKTSLPKEFGESKQTFQKVSIFMSVFNVHVNRTPIAGTITKTIYVPGKFINAELDKASEDNERQLIMLETKNKDKVAFVQIAGLIARRILCEVDEGDKMETGERFGLIRFGSRVDVYLPESVKLKVKKGQTTVAGETIIGKF